MKKEERKKLVALNLIVSAVIFCILLITVAIAAFFGYILVRTGVVNVINKEALSPNRTILLMSINSLILGAITTAIISKISMKPVNKIIEQMNRLASGDFKARLDFGKPLGNHPAVVNITDSFNKMAQELENTEMLRGDFVNNFSHEFKTPIVSIAGFAKLLKRGNLTEKQKAEYIDIIEEESMRLSAMATNVLNMTKVENQTILTNVSEFNLSEQLRSSVLMLEPRWTKKAVDFDLNFSEHMIEANEELLKHVWTNLIDNAIKFSQDGGTVEINVKDDEETISVSILNRGSEIAPEQQNRIFHKFYQADESHASEGNGIGLALVKQVTELHKGKVSVWSKNNTTVFTVELPKNL